MRISRDEPITNDNKEMLSRSRHYHDNTTTIHLFGITYHYRRGYKESFCKANGPRALLRILRFFTGIINDSSGKTRLSLHHRHSNNTKNPAAHSRRMHQQRVLKRKLYVKYFAIIIKQATETTSHDG